MDRSWIHEKIGDRYNKGVDEFLEFAFLNSSVEGKIRCPCKKCLNRLWKTRYEVRTDLICIGFDPAYDQWDAHGEAYRPKFVDAPIVEDNDSDGECEDSDDDDDDIRGLLHDAFGPLASNNCVDEETDSAILREEPNEAADKFYKLLKESETELYPECTRFSRLSFTAKLLHIKSLTGMTNKAVDMILELLNQAFPKDHKLPKSHYEAKKITRDLGLKYEKIDACINDCVLFRKKFAKRKKCPKCKESRWEPDPTIDDNDETSTVPTKRKRIPRKVLRYFPLKSRLQRLFMSDKTASSMRWHHEERVDDGVLRHPADSEVWKSFDKDFESFASEPRNVRLGLASDGMNPFGNMSNSHSTWPVVLIPYNLPGWMCMKRPFFILSMLISGPTAPGNDIDVYLQPLIDELLELWDEGVETYDASKKQNFLLRAMLLWTINDFPAYANLSGWSTKGYLACPVCMEETDSIQLKHGRKCSYMGHRRFLPQKHRWRAQKTTFDGKKENKPAPKRLSGKDIVEKLKGFKQVQFGKKRKREDEVILPGNFKKKSVFFQLPYWKHIKLRHNLDPMHIEKNVFDITFGTCMNFEGKTKDNLKARLDLQEMGIRKDLWPKLVGDKYSIADACYLIEKGERGSVCDNWKKIKVPDGYSSNISRCVNSKERKITGLKSHDCHVLLQQFLPLALTETSLPKEVKDALIELCAFFKLLCGKTLIIKDLEQLEEQIAETLCKLERIFPPSFFVVMMHLPIHLAEEAKMAGPVQYRWMYPIERYLHTLKSYVRNKAHPEGSIAEGYIAEECLTFCSRFLGGIETKFNRPERNYDGHDVEPQPGGDSNSYGDNSFRVDTPEVGSSSSPQPTGGSTRKRGPTKGLSLFRDIPPGTRVQVELQCGKPVGKHENTFKTCACVWLKQTCHIPLDVTSFQDITQDIKDRFWNRLQDKFELFHSTVKRRKVGPRVSSDEPTSVSSTPTSEEPSSPTFEPSSSHTSASKDIVDLSTRLPRANEETKEMFFKWMAKIYKDRRHDLHVQYQKFNNDADRMKNCPPDISMDEWRFLVSHFGSPKFKTMSERNKKNRAKLDIKTTSGSQNFLSKRRQMTEDNGGVEPDDVAFFEATHRRKDGTPVDEKSAQFMNEMADLTEKVKQGEIALTQTGIVHKVIHPPRKGRCLLWGDGISPTQLYGPQGSQEERHQQELEEQRRLLEARHAKELAKRDEEAAAKEAQMEAIVARAVAQALQALGVPVPSPADNHLQDDDVGG